LPSSKLCGQLNRDSLGILQQIHLGVTDRGLFYRLIHSVKAALLKIRRRDTFAIYPNPVGFHTIQMQKEGFLICLI
jgi:hypothetical protein